MCMNEILAGRHFRPHQQFRHFRSHPGIVDLNLSRPVAPGWELLARVGNLGDRRYETAAGYRMPPRSLMLTARYTGR